jgi:hypothetical protein
MIYFVTEVQIHSNQVNTWFFPTYRAARKFIQPSNIRGKWVSTIDENSTKLSPLHPNEKVMITIARRLATFTKYNGKHILTISVVNY